MVGNEDAADPVRIAAEIAPQLDRLRLAIVRQLNPNFDELSQQYDVPAAALKILGNLRNLLPDRVVAVDDVLAVFLYSPPDEIRGALDELVTSGVLESARGHAVTVTEKGRDIVHAMFATMQEFIDRHWADHAELVGSLLPLADRACDAAAETGGDAMRVVAPPYDPPNASPALLLAERLTPLRFHRFDAHAAAWREEGLTVEEIQSLEPGPQRERIEAETNRRAAAPYAVLDADERLQLLAGLAELPG